MSTRNSSMDLLDKIKYIFSNPKFFFDSIKREEGIKNSLILYAIVGAVMTSISVLFGFMIRGTGSNYFGMVPSTFDAPMLMAPATFILGIIITFVYSGMVHLVVMGFKGRGNYANTYSVYTYSSIPSLILSTIPIIGIVGSIYSLVLTIIGISRVHNISTGKSVLACILPVVLALGIIIIAVLYTISKFRSLYGF